MPLGIREISLNRKLFPQALIKSYSCADLTTDQKQVKVVVGTVILICKKRGGLTTVEKQRELSGSLPRLVDSVRIVFVVRQENASSKVLR